MTTVLTSANIGVNNSKFTFTGVTSYVINFTTTMATYKSYIVSVCTNNGTYGSFYTYKIGSSAMNVAAMFTTVGNLSYAGSGSSYSVTLGSLLSGNTYSVSIIGVN